MMVSYDYLLSGRNRLANVRAAVLEPVARWRGVSRRCLSDTRLVVSAG
jgi:hypothetical protein